MTDERMLWIAILVVAAVAIIFLSGCQINYLPECVFDCAQGDLGDMGAQRSPTP